MSLAASKEDDAKKTYAFALDRIKDLEVKEPEGFTFPYDFNARAHYAHAYGIYRMDGKPERVCSEYLIRRFKGICAIIHFTSQKITKERETTIWILNYRVSNARFRG